MTAQTNLQRYTKAIVEGRLFECIAIEKKFDLYGYPPEVVCAGLRAADDGLSVDAAVDAYLSGNYAEQSK